MTDYTALIVQGGPVAPIPLNRHAMHNPFDELVIRASAEGGCAFLEKRKPGWLAAN